MLASSPVDTNIFFDQLQAKRLIVFHHEIALDDGLHGIDDLDSICREVTAPDDKAVLRGRHAALRQIDQRIHLMVANAHRGQRLRQ